MKEIIKWKRNSLEYISMNEREPPWKQRKLSFIGYRGLFCIFSADINLYLTVYWFWLMHFLMWFVPRLSEGESVKKYQFFWQPLVRLFHQLNSLFKDENQNLMLCLIFFKLSKCWWPIHKILCLGLVETGAASRFPPSPFLHSRLGAIVSHRL